MPKLIAQLTVAALICAGLGILGLDWGWRIGGLVLGIVVMHVLWERLAFDPVVDLGRMPFPNDDPLMHEAVARARTELPRFLALHPQYRRRSFVRFPFRSASGITMHVWGRLLAVHCGRAQVVARTAPAAPTDLLDPALDIAVDDISDWQIRLPDGNVLGGYTNRAACRVFEREQGHLPAAIQRRLQRFRDLPAA